MLTSKRDPEINSRSELSILILVSKLLVSALILLEIKSISPLKILSLKLDTFASIGKPFSRTDE